MEITRLRDDINDVNEKIAVQTEKIDEFKRFSQMKFELDRVIDSTMYKLLRTGFSLQRGELH